MEALDASNRPLGAYEIAARSRKSGMNLAPNQVYRILDRLIARGDVQRVELLASYLPARGKRSGFMVCRSCKAVETFEMEELADALAPLCKTHGFAPSASVVELSGLCTECTGRESDAAAPPREGRPHHVGRGMQSLLALLTAAGAAVLSAPAEAMPRTAAMIEESGCLEERSWPGRDGGICGRSRLLLHR